MVEMEGGGGEVKLIGRSLSETPTWSVATVITILVALGFLFQHSIERFRKWLVKTRRKALLAALQRIMEELMHFGVLSLLLGHWTIWLAKICIKSSAFSRRFYPCVKEFDETILGNSRFTVASDLYLSNHSNSPKHVARRHEYCPAEHQPFASYESLEQLHRLLIVLAVVHVSYSFCTVALAMLKIDSWRKWEDQARQMISDSLQGSSSTDPKHIGIRRQSTFVFHHTSHPWSQNKVLVWVLCFMQQFWRSISKADYMALRLGFITNHDLHPTYNFHHYMLRSMEDEFREIVGISVLLWIYAIICIFVNVHGTNAYFWLSFVPALLIVLVGTKLHHIVVQLALEVMDAHSSFSITGKPLNLRDELFWFRKPKLLLSLIQAISFQNAFEMATFIWSLWEIRDPSCFMKNRAFIFIRLTSGILFQFWCSYNTFPLYVIITQMGSKFKKALITESVRQSLHGWRERVKHKRGRDHDYGRLVTAPSVTSLDSMDDDMTVITIDTTMEDSELPCEDDDGERPESSSRPIQENPDEICEEPQNEEEEPMAASSCSGSCSEDEDKPGFLPSSSIKSPYTVFDEI